MSHRSIHPFLVPAGIAGLALALAAGCVAGDGGPDLDTAASDGEQLRCDLEVTLSDVALRAPLVAKPDLTIQIRLDGADNLGRPLGTPEIYGLLDRLDGGPIAERRVNATWFLAGGGATYEALARISGLGEVGISSGAEAGTLGAGLDTTYHWVDGQTADGRAAFEALVTIDHDCTVEQVTELGCASATWAPMVEALRAPLRSLAIRAMTAADGGASDFVSGIDLGVPGVSTQGAFLYAHRDGDEGPSAHADLTLRLDSGVEERVLVFYPIVTAADGAGAPTYDLGRGIPYFDAEYRQPSWCR